MRIKIKQFGEHIATAGLHFEQPKDKQYGVRRKLEPNEVVEIDDDDPLLREILETGKVEVTTEPATRPLDFESTEEARYTSPSYRSRGEDTDIEIERYTRAVNERMAAQQAPAASPPPDPDVEQATADVVGARPRRQSRRARERVST